MEFIQSPQLDQKLILTQEMRQSLAVLQMNLPELRAYVEDVSLRNPLVELEYSEEDCPEESPRWQEASANEGEDMVLWEEPMLGSRDPEDMPFGTRCPASSGQALSLDWVCDEDENDFSAMLQEQLLRMNWLDDFTASLCSYLIDCLDERGYLRFSLEELAREQGVSFEQMEQALYVLQSLQPTGVGARSLEECLILQLAQSDNFCSETLHLVKDGLPLLGKRDYNGIARLLNCSPARAQQAAQAIFSLNPIPSQGYSTGTTVEYQYPEADVRVEDGRILLEMNHWMLPTIHISQTAQQLLMESGKKEDASYLTAQKKDAQTLVKFVENREATLVRLLRDIVKIQSGYFLRGESLVPMTMSQLAQQEGLSCSTVSRALVGKSIRFGRRTLYLKDLFTTAIASETGTVSSDGVKTKLKMLVEREDPQHPLSDEALRIALAAAQLPVSRRTVAKYREELGIPSSSKRRKLG